MEHNDSCPEKKIKALMRKKKIENDALKKILKAFSNDDSGLKKEPESKSKKK